MNKFLKSKEYKMVFPKEEKRNSSKKTNCYYYYKERLAKMFNDAKSIEEFKIEADLLGAPKRICMPFLLYYYARNLSLPVVYAVIIAISILVTTMLCYMIEYMHSLGGYFGATFAGVICGLAIGIIVIVGPFNTWYYSMKDSLQ